VSNFWHYPDNPKFWEGQTAFILGGGPSLDMPLGRLYDKNVIGVNEAFKLGDWVDVNFIGDYKYYNHNKMNLYNYNGITVSCVGGTINDPNVLTVYSSNEVMTLKKGRIGKSLNSGISAINLAYQFGVKEIVLLGFDMGIHNGQNWHNNNVAINQFKKQITEKYYAKVRSVIESRVSDVLEKAGVKVVNCTPDSQLECFEKMSLDEYFLQQDKYINDFNEE